MSALPPIAFSGGRPLHPPTLFSSKTKPFEAAPRSEATPASSDADDDFLKEHKGLPPELALLMAIGLIGAFNPVAIAPLTQAVDTNFLINYNVLDFAGMGVPRVSRSLQRGAEPYDEENDPVAQEKTGLDRWFYVKKERIKRSNWENLWEEFLREVQAAPGALLIPTLALAALPVISRKTGWPAGGRALLLSSDALKEQTALLKKVAQTASAPLKKDAASLQTSLEGYYKHLLDHPEAERIASIPLHFQFDLAKTPTYSEFIVKTKARELLYAHRHTLPLGLDAALTKPQRSWRPFKTLPQPFELKDVRFEALKNEWSQAMARLSTLETLHPPAFFNRFTPAQLQERELLQSKIALYNHLLERSGVEINNHLHPQQSEALRHWPVAGSTVSDLGEFLKETDRYRDLLTTALRDALPSEGASSLQQVAALAQQRLVQTGTFKIAFPVATVGLMMYWMYYLSHAIQKGRLYPANRLILEEGTKPIPKEEAVPSVNLNPFQLESLLLGSSESEAVKTRAMARFQQLRRPDVLGDA